MNRLLIAIGKFEDSHFLAYSIAAISSIFITLMVSGSIFLSLIEYLEFNFDTALGYNDPGNFIVWAVLMSIFLLTLKLHIEMLDKATIHYEKRYQGVPKLIAKRCNDGTYFIKRGKGKGSQEWTFDDFTSYNNKLSELRYEKRIALEKAKGEYIQWVESKKVKPKYKYDEK